MVPKELESLSEYMPTISDIEAGRCFVVILHGVGGRPTDTQNMASKMFLVRPMQYLVSYLAHAVLLRQSDRLKLAAL